jgi:hypothetical protein
MSPLNLNHQRSISRRDLLRGGAALAVGVLGASSFPPPGASAAPETPTPVKTRSTYYTAAKIAGARNNIANYSWAQAIRDKAVAEAAPLIAAGPEFGWSSITTQGLPRSYAVNQTLGSPITGKDIYQYGAYAWLADPFSAPWKLTDPSSGYVFPTNDFASFYASALDEHGNFDRALGDPQYLKNTLYPERGEGWGVDDGYGWIDDDGNKWTFVAYYNHWWVWGYNAKTAGGGALVMARLPAVRDAYLYTGDAQYAHLGLIMLDRIADVYPAMDTSVYTREDGYLNSDGRRAKGKVVGDIWEATGLALTLVSYYDAFYPAIADAADAGVVDFLSAKAAALGLPDKSTTAGIRANIENGIVRQIYPAVMDAQIIGNFGTHQSTLAMAAVVLDHRPESKEWLDFVFAPGGLSSEPDWHVTGGNVEATLVDQVDRDGWGFESSPGYNLIWMEQMSNLADILNGYDGYPAADLYNNPKYHAMIAAPPSLTMVNAYTPSIGDSGQTGEPGIIGSVAQYVTAFERYGDPVYAQMAYLLNKGDVASLYSGMFAADAAGTQARIRDVISEQGPLQLPSNHETGYGFAALRDGAEADMRGLMLYHGRNWGHGHANSLRIALYGYGLNLAPALGYPEFADENARQIEWNNNTVAGNAVVVDASPQAHEVIGQPRDFMVTDDVQMVEVESPLVYPQTSMYRRTSAMIRVDEANSYVVDLFRVRGGAEQVFSFHGAEGPVTTTGLDLAAQDGGSYAGPDVTAPPDDATPRPGASGFDWLVNVERATPSGPFSVDWAITDTYGVNDPPLPVHLRATMLTDVAEAALADGIPPRNKPGNPASLRYLLAKRQAATGTALASDFLSVLEPYNGSRFVSSIAAAPIVPASGTLEEGDAQAVKIEHVNGRVDYVVFSLNPDAQLKVDDQLLFRGAFGVLALQGRNTLFAATSEGTQMVALTAPDRGLVRAMSAMSGAITGHVTAFTQEMSEANSVSIALSAPLRALEAADLVGCYLYAENDGIGNAAYAITSVTSNSPRTATLGTRGTTVRSFADDADPDAGYDYDLSVGAAVRIPLARHWRP